MTRLVLLALLSGLTLVIALWRDLATKERGTPKRWRRSLYVGLILVALNAGLDVEKRLADRSRAAASEAADDEERRLMGQIRDDLGELDRSFAQTLQLLDANIRSLPAATASRMKSELREVHDELRQIRTEVERKPADRSRLDQIGVLVDKSRSVTERLTRSVQSPSETTASPARLDRVQNKGPEAKREDATQAPPSRAMAPEGMGASLPFWWNERRVRGKSVATLSGSETPSGCEVFP
jgi:hypothetical protein